MTSLLVLGATSGIAQAVIRRAAERGDRLHLVARNGERLEAVAADARLRGAAGVTCTASELAVPARVAGVLDGVWAALGGAPERVLIAYGLLGDERVAQRDVALAQRMLQVNFTSVVAWCEGLIGRMSGEGRGGSGVNATIAANADNAANSAIAVIGSVAGDRGRASVAIYGAAKAGLDAYLAALRHRLAGRGPRIVTIKPGYVDTPMTARMRKNPLFAGPAEVAGPILDALDRGNGVRYVPWFWRWIMLVVRLVPRSVLHRTRL